MLEVILENFRKDLFGRKETAPSKLGYNINPRLGADKRPEMANYLNIVDPETGEVLPQYQKFFDQFTTPVESQSYLNEFSQRLEGIPEVEYRGDITTDEIGAGERYGEAGRGVDVLAERAYGTEIDPWTKLQIEQQQMQESGAREDLLEQSARAQERAQQQLAMRGGLSEGARERLAQSGMEQRMTGMQNIGRAGEAQRLGILGQGEQQRLALQQMLPQQQMALEQYGTGLDISERDKQLALQQANRQAEMAAQQAAAQQGIQQTGLWGNMAQTEAARDLQTQLANQATQQKAGALALGDIRGLNEAQLRAYSEAMRGWAAEKTADEMKKSSGSGGLLGMGGFLGVL